MTTINNSDNLSYTSVSVLLLNPYLIQTFFTFICNVTLCNCCVRVAREFIRKYFHRQKVWSGGELDDDYDNEAGKSVDITNDNEC